ncbi:flagellar basal body P-ring formation chaperone FlgA [Pontivivens ytuae]|uniref:Flagella basal body P-ring formation protein FlgA n=1 Tax=Pontivivens ytuae TaxID=2789856 RepID=A0A7S9QBT5_9RHOB|nr:flagellar basal body P-ring formation chaperone FlgA [Pontivivens ytuae]QPH53090.1 flagellar basal body P-ring formation protein FlgA [Pontivivens ytuae]
MRSLIFLAALVAFPAMAQSVQPIRAIRAETVIRYEDVIQAAESVPGGITSIEQAVGQEARVTLYPGRPILITDLAEPAVINRNDVVEMQFASGGLAIVTEGRVLDRARVGDRVRVMNLASRLTVWGEVMPSGRVEVSR